MSAIRGAHGGNGARCGHRIVRALQLAFNAVNAQLGKLWVRPTVVAHLEAAPLDFCGQFGVRLGRLSQQIKSGRDPL
jgi:hypothetical protein